MVGSLVSLACSASLKLGSYCMLWMLEWMGQWALSRFLLALADTFPSSCVSLTMDCPEMIFWFRWVNWRANLVDPETNDGPEEYWALSLSFFSEERSVRSGCSVRPCMLLCLRN